MMGDFELLKEVPGYKAILKVVLKSQIQLLVDQLCKYTGEESCILTANASDGAQSLLGSSTGKRFLENHNEIKTQFLGHCLKSLHVPGETTSCLRNKRTTVRSHPYSRSNTSSPTSKNPTSYNERNSFTELESLNVQDENYLNETRNGGSRLPNLYPSSIPVSENTVSGYKKKEGSQQGSVSSPSPDAYYSRSYMQTSGDIDHNSENNRENNVVMVKQEVDVDDVEVMGVELGQQSFLAVSDEHLNGFQGNQIAASFDDSELVTSEPNASDVSASKHYYPCRFCGRVFQHNSWLTRHIRGHTGEKPYECHICGKRFTRAGTMKVHMLMHSEIFTGDEKEPLKRNNLA